MKEYGLEYLRGKLAARERRVNLRYEYYEMKNRMRKITALIPPEFLSLTYALGWCAKAVDSLADRIVFDGFAHDDFMLGDLYGVNNPDVLFDSAVLSALISSCCFLHIGYGDGEYPVIEVIDGKNATGIIDQATGLLTEGYAILSRDDKTGAPVSEAYFLPDRTEFYELGELSDVQAHPAGAPLLVPVIFRPDAKRPFGHSRISRACMDIVQTARRTLLRSEVGAEFYSVPQKYIVGISQKAEFDNRLAALSSFLKIPRDNSGSDPTVGAFPQQSMQPHMEHMKMLASMFAGETGLTLDDLGFTTDNPASYDAIRASHESLRLTARKAQRSFGAGFLNAGYLAACLRDDFTYKRSAFRNVKPRWMPIFEPDGAALGALGDAILKINQAVPDLIGAEAVRQLTGLTGDAP